MNPVHVTVHIDSATEVRVTDLTVGATVGIADTLDLLGDPAHLRSVLLDAIGQLDEVILARRGGYSVAEKIADARAYRAVGYAEVSGWGVEVDG